MPETFFSDFEETINTGDLKPYWSFFFEKSFF